MRTPLEGYKFDYEAAVVVFTSGSNAFLCKKIITIIWRCGELTNVKGSPLGVVLKENPKPPIRIVEA